MTFVIIIIYREQLYQKERNQEEVFDSRAMSLSNKNRRKKAKQMKRDEGGMGMCTSLLSPIYAPLPLGSILSLFL
ncbi:MAG TPA: hypothetical protein VHF44_01465 [Nitrososphaeraceae archaeon]|nr:hypothetical protein [Nitrososphaeraceae archaeon]